MIDDRAVIDPNAELDEGVTVGPFAVIGSGVQIGKGTEVGPHAVIRGPSRIGRDNRIYQFASVGEDPQDRKYAGEDTVLEIGDRNTIREFATVHRGTVQDESITSIGNDNLLLAYSHVAHDCRIGNQVLMSNAASLGGHVHIDDWAILGGFSLVHQFCRIGQHCFTAMGSVISRDVPPYVLVQGNPAKPRGINIEGLRRRNFSPEDLAVIKRAYRLIYMSGTPLAGAREQIEAAAADEGGPMQVIADFLGLSRRSLQR